jgi:hypothetical protein
MASVRRVTDTGIVLTTFVPKHATMDDFSIRWRLSKRNAVLVCFNTNVAVETPTQSEAAVARSHVQNRSQVFAVLPDQPPEQRDHRFRGCYL